MDGYSVQEAASVLGVAEGRVWELLARGVLLGTPEGDSMRVFLKSQPGPIANAGTRDEPQRTNGNGGSHGDGEASAFRELLTEFRNLTERYGQALLALGEARGEVAGLRSRVDQLEARLDLRLPPPLEATPVAWESATIPASAPTSSPPASPPRRAPVRRPPRSRKAPSARETVAGFADALARAQDPNAADLGESGEAEAPLEASAEPAVVEPPTEVFDQEAGVAAEPQPEAELAAEPEALAPEPDIALDEVATAAETVDDVVAAEAAAPAEDVEPPTYSAIVVEPDWFADGDFAWLDAADIEAAGSASAPVADQSAVELPAEPADFDQPMAEAEIESPTLEAVEPQAEPAEEPIEPVEAETEAAFLDEPVPLPEPMLEPLPEPEPVAAFEAETEYEPWQSPEPSYPTEMGGSVGDSGATDASLPESEVSDGPEPRAMSSSVAVRDLEEEVMWLGADPDPLPPVEPLPQQRAESAPWPAVDAAPHPMQGVRPPLAMTEDELSRLAQDEGWDENEVAAIRAMITPIPSGPVDLPGAAELHEAMAALEAVPVRTDPAYDVSRQWAKPAPDDQPPTRHDDWAFEAEPAAPAPRPAPLPPIDVASTLRRSATDPNWLRRRQGPAAEAYRRLRRLFPG
ncbi:MAG TPA: hypothetical protein VL687_02070 [Methylomirabilota bacterium]|nr:hypothetical protein [Methylomirabilota bacterium]